MIWEKLYLRPYIVMKLGYAYDFKSKARTVWVHRHHLDVIGLGSAAVEARTYARHCCCPRPSTGGQRYPHGALLLKDIEESN